MECRAKSKARSLLTEWLLLSQEELPHYVTLRYVTLRYVTLVRFVSHRKQKVVNAICCESHTKRIYTLCWQNAKSIHLKWLVCIITTVILVVHIATTSILRVNTGSHFFMPIYVSPDPITNRTNSFRWSDYLHWFVSRIVFIASRDARHLLAFWRRWTQSVTTNEPLLWGLQYPAFVLPEVQGSNVKECSSVTHMRKQTARVPVGEMGMWTSAGDKRE